MLKPDSLSMEVIQIDESSRKIHILLVKEAGTGHQKEIFAHMIIGADGSHSIVSRQKKMVSPRASDRFIGLRAYYDNCYFEPAANIIYDQLTLPGYVWFFPISKNRANMGMIVSKDNHLRTGRNPASIFKHIVNNHPAFNEVRKTPGLFDSIKGFPLNLGSSKGPRVKDGVVLVGDAASFINPLTGGGLFNAMLSGKQAALICAQGVQKNDVSVKTLKLYEKWWKKSLSPSFFYYSLMKCCLRKEKIASWWLSCCTRNRVCANLFLSVYGNPLPRLGPFNPFVLFKILTAK